MNRAIQLALDLRVAVNSHPLISKYFQILGADQINIAGPVSEFRLCGLPDSGRELGHGRQSDARR